MMDPRLAFLVILLLLLSSSVPLAAAWARLLPTDEPEDRVALDPSSLLLLVGVTLCYLAQLPGIPLGLLDNWLSNWLPADWQEGLRIAGKFLMVFVPAYAAAYACFRRGPLRKHLLWAGILVLISSLGLGYLLPFWTVGARP